VRTVVVGERPRELAEWIERRRRLGQDAFDELWNGEYDAVPGPSSAERARVRYELTALLRPMGRRAGLVGTVPFNLGDPDDYRVPDGGLHRGHPTEVYLPTAALVIGVLSPGDETYDKFGLYAKRGVEELLVADPQRRAVQIWLLRGDGYTEAGAKPLARDRYEVAVRHGHRWRARVGGRGSGGRGVGCSN
jgi:Uma2 family endonuclease